jgi:RNA polymerase sigma factor (sigma-70 family)
MHRSDPELIKACQRGDQAAWNELVDQYGRLVYSIPRRYGLSDADADEVFAGVWATVFRKLDDLRDDTRLSAWLITTTHRECWRVSRKRSTYKELDAHFADVSEPSPDKAEAWERQHQVRRALQTLGGRCEELLTALFLERGGAETRYDVIAERLGMPVGSIGPTRARCFKKLQAILEEMGVGLAEPQAGARAW